MIKAVVFDLDDTLFDEIEYVKCGFKAIAENYGELSIYDTLLDLFLKDRNNVYQRAGFNEQDCEKYISIYRNHMPKLKLPPDSQKILESLKSRGIKLGIITDGRPNGQRNKIIALGLDKIVDEFIITDELGGVEYRKPHRLSFEIMRDRLGVEFNEMIYVGDNPQKDFYIGSIYPITTVRLLKTGFYDDCMYYNNVKECCTINNLEEIYEYIVGSNSYKEK